MFRFTIRELALLTLVVAMGVGWWIDRRSKYQAERRLIHQIEVLEVHSARERALQAQLEGLSELLRLERAESSQPLQHSGE